VPAYTTQRVPQPEAGQSSSAPTAAPTLNRIDRSVDPSAGGGGSGSGPWWSDPVTLGIALGVLVLVLLALAPRSLRALTRRRRWSGADGLVELVEVAWQEIRDTAVDLGVAFDDHVTLRTAAADLVQSFGRPGEEDDALARGAFRGPDAAPEAAAALDRIVRLVERGRYARHLPSDATTADRVHADVDACVEALEAGAGQRRRRRAAWLPASLSWAAMPGRVGPRRGPTLEPGVDRAI
jgi:hypothetical protein